MMMGAAVDDPKRRFATVVYRTAKGSFDHFVGNREYVHRNGEAERLGGLEVDDQLERGRLQDRKIGGLCAIKDLAGVGTRVAIGAAKSKYRIWATSWVAKCSFRNF